jgi:hypothetical protein
MGAYIVPVANAEGPEQDEDPEEGILFYTCVDHHGSDVGCCVVAV